MSMRTPEGISADRVKGFKSENVARFFDFYESELKLNEIKLRGLSPRAKYTDRAAAAGRRS